MKVNTAMREVSAPVLVLLLLAAVYQIHAAKLCYVYSRSCGSASDCCSGCCTTGTCAPADHCSPEIQRACDTYDCPPGKECHLSKVHCIGGPCYPVPSCRPKGGVD